MATFDACESPIAATLGAFAAVLASDTRALILHTSQPVVSISFPAGSRVKHVLLCPRRDRPVDSAPLVCALASDGSVYLGCIPAVDAHRRTVAECAVPPARISSLRFDAKSQLDGGRTFSQKRPVTDTFTTAPSGVSTSAAAASAVESAPSSKRAHAAAADANTAPITLVCIPGLHSILSLHANAFFDVASGMQGPTLALLLLSSVGPAELLFVWMSDAATALRVEKSQRIVLPGLCITAPRALAAFRIATLAPGESVLVPPPDATLDISDVAVEHLCGSLNSSGHTLATLYQSTLVPVAVFCGLDDGRVLCIRFQKDILATANTTARGMAASSSAIWSQCVSRLASPCIAIAAFAGFELPAGVRQSLAVDAICFVAEHGVVRILVTLNHAEMRRARDRNHDTDQRLSVHRWSRDVLLSNREASSIVSAAWISSKSTAHAAALSHAPEIVASFDGTLGILQPFATENQTRPVSEHAGGLDSVLAMFNPFAASSRATCMGLAQSRPSLMILPCRRELIYSSHSVHGRSVNSCSTSSLTGSGHSTTVLSIQQRSASRYSAMFENIPVRRPERVATSARIEACLDRIQQVPSMGRV